MAEFQFIRSSIPKEKEMILAGISKPPTNAMPRNGSFEGIEDANSPVRIKNMSKDTTPKK